MAVVGAFRSPALIIASSSSFCVGSFTGDLARRGDFVPVAVPVLAHIVAASFTDAWTTLSGDFSGLTGRTGL